MSIGIKANGAPDLAAECKKWESQCAELLQERDRLRAELAQMKRMYDACAKSLFHRICETWEPPADLTQEKALACLEEGPWLEELIAELENAPEK